MAIQINDCREKADTLSDHGGKSCTENGKPKIFDEKNIQHGIQDGSDGNKHKRPFAVAHPAQNCADNIIAIDEKQPADTGDHIIHGIFCGSSWGVEPIQYRITKTVTDCRNDQRSAKQKTEHCTNGFPDFVIQAGAD